MKCGVVKYMFGSLVISVFLMPRSGMRVLRIGLLGVVVLSVFRFECCSGCFYMNSLLWISYWVLLWVICLLVLGRLRVMLCMLF